jgi:hypothetical protein
LLAEDVFTGVDGLVEKSLLIKREGCSGRSLQKER